MSKKKTAVIVGASSGVGRALAQELASQQYNLVIAARDGRDLKAISTDLMANYGTDIFTYDLDLLQQNSLENFRQFCLEKLNYINLVLIPAGMVSDDDDGLSSIENIEQLVRVNYLSIIQLMSRFVQQFQRQEQGQLIVFSSIAAASPRSQNAVYAASKKALESYAQSLQHRFADTRIKIQVYALGYIDTSMTFGDKLLLPMVSPQQVAKYVFDNLDSNFRLKYYPRFWAIVIRILKLVPWFIFKRLSF